MKFSEILKFIQKEYDKDFHLIKKFEDGFRNSVYKLKDKNSHYLLVVYKREKGIKERIENIHKVSGKLSETDFNVEIRIPLLTKEEEDFVFISEIKRYAAVYNFIDGKNIPWEEYKRRHLKGMGKVLSNFHYYLRSYDSSSLPKWKDLLLTEFDEMVGYFKKVEPWILKKLRVKAENLKVNELYEFLSALASDEDGVLHYDFVRGNVLITNKILEDDTYEIKGVIDFEKVCKGPFIADIARTLAFLYVDVKFKEEVEVKKWFLERGYIKRGLNKLPNRQMGKWANGQMGKWANGQMDKLPNGQMDKLPNGQMDKWTNGQMDKWANSHSSAASRHGRAGRSSGSSELEKLVSIYWIRDFWKFLQHNPYESLSSNEHYIRTRDKLIDRGYIKFF